MLYEPFVDDPLQKFSNTAEQTDRAVAGRIPLVFRFCFCLFVCLFCFVLFCFVCCCCLFVCFVFVFVFFLGGVGGGGMGLMTASFQIVGTVLVDQLWLLMRSRVRFAPGPRCFNISFVIPSGPGAFFCFIFFSASSSSRSVRHSVIHGSKPAVAVFCSTACV